MTDDQKKTILVIGTGAGGLRALTGERRPAPIADQVEIPPAIAGAKGRAWRVDFAQIIEAVLAKHPEKRGQDATVGLWIVEAAWAHPIWHSYVIGMSHLRPLPGLAPAVRTRPGASHEFWVWAASPDAKRADFIRGAIGIETVIMHPLNFAAQLQLADDAAAIAQVESAIADICAGDLNPDTDAFDKWVERFGPSLVRPEFQKWGR